MKKELRRGALLVALGAVVALTIFGCTRGAGAGSAAVAAESDATITVPATSTPEPPASADGTGAVVPTATTEPTSVAVPAITVTAVGDMIFDSSPKRLMRAQGPTAPFSKVASILKKADVTVGNLESPLSKRGSPVPGKTFTFQGDPRAVQGLNYAGFDLLAMANNHARDYGAAALADTIRYLDAGKLAHAGAGATRTAAWKPAIIERNGARIAFLSFSEITPSNFAATSSRSGTAYTQSIDKVLAAIRAAKKKADYVIVSFHWGIEGNYSPTARQVSEGRAAIRAGANLVLSHHPHVIQGVEFYRKGLIAYSLGNFIFDPLDQRRHDSLILRLTVSQSGVTSVTATPVYLGSYGRPAVATGSAATRILGIIKKTSRGRGTTVSIRNSVARLTK